VETGDKIEISLELEREDVLLAENIPLNIIYVGYPAEKKPARTQYDPTKVWHNLYDTRWEKE